MLEKSLAGPIGLFVKFSTLQDYGVDKVFFLENGNVDSTQRNIVFIARGDKLSNAQAIAGMGMLLFARAVCSILNLKFRERFCVVCSLLHSFRTRPVAALHLLSVSMAVSRSSQIDINRANRSCLLRANQTSSAERPRES